MGARDTPASPSSGSDAADRPGRTTGVCCWCNDYTKDISVNAYGRYFRMYRSDGTEYSNSYPQKFYLSAPVKTGTEISITVKFKVDSLTGVTAAQTSAAKSALESGVRTHWDNVFTVHCRDPATECPAKSFKVRFVVQWVTSGEDYTLKVHRSYPREGLSGVVMDVSPSTGPWVYAHEFGHAFGLPDEYSTSTGTETVKYIKPDGTLDGAVTAPPIKPSSDASATIMSTHSNNTVLVRHGWCIAIEAQQLLREKLGRDITCTVSK